MRRKKETKRERETSKQNNSQHNFSIRHWSIRCYILKYSCLINVVFVVCFLFYISSHNRHFPAISPSILLYPTKSNRLQLGQIITAFSSVVMAHWFDYGLILAAWNSLYNKIKHNNYLLWTKTHLILFLHQHPPPKKNQRSCSKYKVLTKECSTDY